MRTLTRRLPTMKNLSARFSDRLALRTWTRALKGAALLLGVCLFSVSAFAQPAPYHPPIQQTLYVGKTGNDTSGTGASNNRYRTINRAMVQIQFTDLVTRVLVGPGTYDESVRLPYNTTVWLESEQGPDVTTITGDGSNTAIWLSPDASGNLYSGVQGFSISGNTVTGECGFCAGAVYIYGTGYGDQFFLLDNKISGNITDGSFDAPGAIYIDYGVFPFIIGNEITGNIAQNSVGGILCRGVGGVIANNIIARNRGYGTGGAEIWVVSSLAFSNNTIADNVNTLQGGVSGVRLIEYATAAAQPAGPVQFQTVFNHNIVYGVGPSWAVRSDPFMSTVVKSNLFYHDGDSTGYDIDTSSVTPNPDASNIYNTNPLFADRTAWDYHITCGSPARNAGNNLIVYDDPIVTAHDIDGPPQLRFGPDDPVQIVDIGADEFWDTDKKPAFTSTDAVGCPPHTVHFINQSECYDEEWEWDFGDGSAHWRGTTPAHKNPSHEYTKTGQYTVTLTAIGMLDTAVVIKTAFVTILDPLVADFSADETSGCGSLTAVFTATGEPEIDEFKWFFGDGDSAIGNPISHDFESAGSFDVKLRATNVCGSIEVTKPAYITVFSGANVIVTSNFDPQNPPCPPASVLFAYQSDQTLTNLLWNFGDGGTSTAANPTHVYQSSGVFTVTLTATSDCGAVSVEKTDYISIIDGPSVVVGATPTSGCEATLQVQFTATIVGQFESARWFFDDGSDAPGPNVQHTYTSAGQYEPFLVVVHACGVDTFPLSVPISVASAPVAAFTGAPTLLFETEVVSFTDNSANLPLTWDWDFGDDAGSALQNPTHEYEPGVYTVTLGVTNGCGQDTEVKSNYIQMGSFRVTCDSTGKSGDVLLYTIDVDSLVIGYDHTVTLTARLIGTPRRGSMTFQFDAPTGTPPFTTTMRATPTGGLASGVYSIEVKADDPLRMSKTHLCTLNFTGRQLIELPASPIIMSPTVIGNVSNRTVVVRNTAAAGSGITLVVQNPAVTGSAFSIVGAGGTLQPQQTLNWEVSFAPPIVGDFEGNLHVVSNDPVAQTADIVLLGEGIEIRDTLPPCVVSTNPPDGEEISIDSVIRVAFTEGMVPPVGQPLRLESSTGPVSGVAFWETKRRVRFTPSGFLPPDEIITVTVFATLSDSAANTLDGDCDSTSEGSPADDYIFEFTTGPGVYPGDTDNDGFVNEGDIIPLGRFWEMEGPPRTNPQTGFTIQPATAWDPRTATYADADGNGIVDSLDICPVIDFFDQEAGLSKAAVDSWMAGAPGWSDEIVASLIAALDICDGEGPGRAAVERFLMNLQSSAEPVPNEFALHQNYPNPFNPTTIISYTLRQSTHVRLEIFDIQGRLVRVLEDHTQSAGRHSLVWDSRDSNDRPVASGIYFYRLTTPEFHFSRKMVLVR